MITAGAGLVVAIRDGAIAAGAVAGALVAIAAAVRLPVIRRPGMWLWRRLIGEPATEWMHRALASSPMGERVRGIEAQVHPNGGGSLLDIARRNSGRLDSIEARAATVVDRLDVIDQRLAAGEVTFRAVEARLAAVEHPPPG